MLDRAMSSEDISARENDLQLAAACVAGDPAALATLDARLPGILRPALAKLGVPASDDDEIVQRTRVALLAPDESGRCGLAGYTGRGELRAYLRSVGVRIALKRMQRETQPGSDDASELLTLLPDARDTAELQLLKQRYRADLRTAFAEAFGELSARERTLLRQHYLDGLSVDLLAPLHQVHRSTCARWIEAARIKILRGVRHRLRAALGLDDGELDRVLELVRSQLDLSLSRHLAPC
jgi:RNA polymerase sigma-70 factor (ECF subfamily)